MNILVLNPGGNSLKIDIVACEPNQRYAFESAKLLSVIIEGIGKDPKLSRLDGKKSIDTESIEAQDYAGATESLLNWYVNARGDFPDLTQINRAAIRVVHGGCEFDLPTTIDQTVEKKIIAFEELAPLHTKSSIEVLAPLRRKLKRLANLHLNVWPTLSPAVASHAPIRHGRAELLQFPVPVGSSQRSRRFVQRNRGQIAKYPKSKGNTIPSGITFDCLIRPVCSSNLYLFRLPRGVSTTTCCISEIPLLV
jgi:hypothetical protein